MKVKTVQAPFDTARKGHLIPSDPPVVACSRVIPSDRPVIACSIPGCLNVVIPDGDTACTYRQLRAAARRRKWGKDELGLDCCPAHPKGRVTEPVEPPVVKPAEEIGEVLDGPDPDPRIRDVTDPDLDAPDGAVVDGMERVGDQWIRQDADVWESYAENLDATQELTLGRFITAHEEQAAEEGPDPLDGEPPGDGEERAS